MRKLILGMLLVAVPVIGAAAGAVHLDEVDMDLTDQAALQRGAKYFVNYCLNCHSAKYMRYNRMGRDIGLGDDEVAENLMFTAEKVGETMRTAIRPKDAETWFGVVPPDLTLITRAKKNGSAWLYTYLRSFYLDETRPFGVNNTVFPDVGMPHVLWRLQGLQKAVYRSEKDAAGNEKQVFDRFELARPGQLSAQEYDALVRDLVTFMTYMGEPMQLERRRLGIYVLVFLGVFFVIAFLLKKEYWKDVH